MWKVKHRKVKLFHVYIAKLLSWGLNSKRLNSKSALLPLPYPTTHETSGSLLSNAKRQLKLCKSFDNSIWKNLTSPSVGEDVQWWGHSFATGNSVNWNTHLGTLYALFIRLKINKIYDISIPLIAMDTLDKSMTMGIDFHLLKCIRLFILGLFVIAQTSQVALSSRMDEYIVL